MLSVGSLFAGIGGFDLGLERAGMRTVWFCEQEPFCRAVLAKHWPGVPCYPDVTELRGADVEPVDVLCGGFPCQDLSYAGAGAGLAGARSGLWSEYARLVGELRPRYVVVENVSALLARGLGVVLGDLATLGYDAEWDCIPASAVGAPHQRDRVWLVAYPNSDDGRPGRQRRPVAGGQGQPVTVRALQDPDADQGRCEELSQPDGRPERPQQPAPQRSDADGLRAALADSERTGLEGHGRGPLWQGPTSGGSARADVADTARHAEAGAEPPPGAERQRAWASRERSAGHVDWWVAEPDVGRVAHGVPARVDRLAALGNALVPQIAEWIGGRIVAYEAEREELAA